MPVAGRLPRASCPRLTRYCSHFAILASLDQQRRLSGTGSPLLPLVAQVFNLCVFSLPLVAQVFNLCVFSGRIGTGPSSLACGTGCGGDTPLELKRNPYQSSQSASARRSGV